MGVGGSIPFVGPFVDAFGGIPALLLGPGDPTSRIHGEDESLHLGDWRSLVEAEVRLLAELADAPR
jgi:acetylornithine deacetylase/succinyl-diaminopimelate desuccinylase-like protein